MDADLPFWICIVLGAITGSIGRVIRDAFFNEVPLIVRKDIYALAFVAGGVVYFACTLFNIATT